MLVPSLGLSVLNLQSLACVSVLKLVSSAILHLCPLPVELNYPYEVTYSFAFQSLKS